MPAKNKPPRCIVCLRPTATAAGKPTKRRDRCRCREVFATANKLFRHDFSPSHSNPDLCGTCLGRLSDAQHEHPSFHAP